MKIYKSYLIICLFIGVALGNVLIVNAIIPETQDLYQFDYNWQKDYQYRDEALGSWANVRTSATANTKSTSNSPPFRVWTSESRGKYFIDRSIAEVDLTALSNFWYIDIITFKINVTGFSDNNNNAKLYLFNGSNFSYNNLNDYSYFNHYQPVTNHFPNGNVVITGTGNYEISWGAGAYEGFNSYVSGNKMNLSMIHGDDYANSMPQANDDNYIEFNITAIEVYVVSVAGFKSHGTGWNLISIPVNSVIQNTDLYIRNSTNNYTWANAVLNNIIQSDVYGYNATSERYYLTSEMNGNVGYWLFMNTDYELWHTNFSVGGAVVCVHNENDYLFISGLDLEPITVVLVLFGLFWWTANTKQDAGLMLLSSVILLGLAVYYIALFEILSSLFGVAILLVSLYGFALTIEFINSNNGKIRKK